MSGFLHQLAARSLGLTPSIRPRAASPFAPLPADRFFVEQPGEEMAPTLRRPEPTDDGAPMHHPTPSPRHAAPAPVAEMTGPVMAAVVAAVGPMSPALPVENPPSRPLPRPMTPSETPREASTEPLGAIREPWADLDRLVSQVLNPGRNAQPEAPRAGTPPTDRPPSDMPDMPGPSTVRAQQTSRQHPRHPSREAAAASPEAPEAPEVHITIGRLEVNPPARPAPLPPPRPRGPTPLSLSDYLALRHRGRP